jgi:Zn-dependent peptidase ImmA (M78 family)
MAEKITSINSKILQWARVMSGTSLEEAGERMGGLDRVLSWEEGKDYPTYSQLKKICEIYRKPVAVCFFPEPPKIKNIPASCRTLPQNVYNSFSRNLIKVIDEARIMQLNLYELNDNINPNAIKLLDISPKNYDDSKKVAAELRKILGADLDVQKQIKKLEDAFEYWRDCFFQMGIYVFKSAFKENDVSGFCLYDSDFPIIYINNSFAPARQIFTLFHECYHLICNTSGVDFLNDNFLNSYNNSSDEAIERACNRFAGEFLVPDDDFDLLIKNRVPTDSLISTLANTYCVSREVILRKFLDRKKISPEEYQEKRDQYNSDYFRRKEEKKEGKKPQGDYYNTQAAYRGKHYLQLAYGKYYENKISILQLAKYMNMKIPSVQALAAKKGWGSVQ